MRRGLKVLEVLFIVARGFEGTDSPLLGNGQIKGIVLFLFKRLVNREQASDRHLSDRQVLLESFSRFDIHENIRDTLEIPEGVHRRSNAVSTLSSSAKKSEKEKEKAEQKRNVPVLLFGEDE